MSKGNLSHLAVAKRLADESGRHLSECMTEAADIIVRERHKPRLPKERALYLVWAGVSAGLVANSILSIMGVGTFIPSWAASTLLVLSLMNIFWLSPELPLMSRFWTRWNTPLFIAAMAFVTVSSQPIAFAVNDLALILYLGIALLALLHGARDPGLALEKRIRISRLMYPTLSAADQGRIFFLAPWLSPFSLKFWNP